MLPHAACSCLLVVCCRAVIHPAYISLYSLVFQRPLLDSVTLFPHLPCSNALSTVGDLRRFDAV